jgi:hypothetical protein
MISARVEEALVVGPEVKKFTYLLDTVEVTGTVREWPDNPLSNGGDGFDLELDDNYAHISSPIGVGKTLHCESYPQISPDQINHKQAWPLPQKPDKQLFTVRVPSTGAKRALQNGDHIRFRGRPVIENGHPLDITNRGLLYVGRVFLEYHPFDWTTIELVEPPRPKDILTYYLFIAAPLYQMIYPQGKWVGDPNHLQGVENHLFLGDTGDLFHNSISANCTYVAAGTDSDGSVSYIEDVITNTTGRSLDEVRQIIQVPNGIRVTASVNSNPLYTYGGINIADVNDPANSRSTLILKYRLGRGHLQPPAGLYSGERLNTNDVIQSPSRTFRLVMQADGNLVEYRATDDAPVWASGTNWSHPVVDNTGAKFDNIAQYVELQVDGNFVVYDRNRSPQWASGTDKHPGAHMNLEDTGKIVISDSNGVTLWTN